MADLLDIAPSTAVDVVKIDGQRYIVRGVSIPAMASIASRFPALKSIATGPSGDDFLARMIAGCGAAIGPIIAAGCGHLGDERYEQRAAALLPEQQLEIPRPNFRTIIPKWDWLLRRGSDAPHRRSGKSSKGSQTPFEAIALNITALIRNGFPPDYTMTLTWKQVVAYLEFSDTLDRIDRAADLMITAAGAQGDQKTLEKVFKELGP